MNGIILINKQKDCTSFDVVSKLRKILNVKKIGHSGTLDPMATGVLPIFIGKATKAIPLLFDTDKSYRAEFKLGIQTDTCDITGKVIEKSDTKVSKEELLTELCKLKGEIDQFPPLYSAVKYRGKPLYKYAREGKSVERISKKVTIHSINLIEFDETEQTGKFEISCSKGTYIRAICDDLGKSLNSFGTLTSLVRTKACGFLIEDCITTDEVKNKVDEKENFLINVDTIFVSLDKVNLDENQKKLFCNGAPVIFKGLIHKSGKVRIYCDSFLGIGHFEKNQLKIDKNLS